jgi:hypothetical protein
MRCRDQGCAAVCDTFARPGAGSDGMPALLCYHAYMSRQLTIRGVSDEVGERLEGLSRARGKSMNATLLEILEAALGISERRRHLSRYVTWNESDLAELNTALAAQRTVDEKLWR